MSEANLLGRFVITQNELDQLERTRLLLHEVARRIPELDLSKMQLYNATQTIWRVVNKKRDTAL